MLFIFARHGQTDHNINGIIQGHLDTPLNAQGRWEAGLLARRLANVPISDIWSSDLSRAHEIVAKNYGIKVRPDPRLRERGLGSMEGRRRLPGERAPADSETPKQLMKRTADWFSERLQNRKERYASDGERNDVILVTSHGAYLSYLLQLLVSQFNFSVMTGLNLNAHCVNTCIMTVHVWWDEDFGWKGRIDTWGDAEHLKGLKDVDQDVVDDVR